MPGLLFNNRKASKNNIINFRQEPDESIESTQINLDELGFILNKDLLENQHSDINFRIGCLERKKLMVTLQ